MRQRFWVIPFLLEFVWRAWRQLRHRISAGKFDVVLRILPLTALLASAFAFFLRIGTHTFRDRTD